MALVTYTEADLKRDPATGRLISSGATLRTKNCKVCNELMRCPYGQGKQWWEMRKYCSNICRQESQKKPIEKVCATCSKQFITNRERINNCSAKCATRYRSITYREDKIGTWKGDEVGYSGLHMWIKSKYGKANRCDFLEVKNHSKTAIFHWANLSGKYMRNIDDWAQLCVKCHFRFDNGYEVI